jgi:hypothetical protein
MPTCVGWIERPPQTCRHDELDQENGKSDCARLSVCTTQLSIAVSSLTEAERMIAPMSGMISSAGSTQESYPMDWRKASIYSVNEE